ncbi:MAG: Crp/Fnr family transcriptional regulator [Nitrospiraceae bacterium]|nr:MAG: Crp/Fnr family transcriptional regulator [Nitrospiraceae bacterium]
MVEKFLREIPVFQNFSDKNLRQTVENFSLRKFKKHETIVYQSDKSTDLYILLKGRVNITFMDPNGKEYFLTELKEGDYFGEMSLIDGKPRSASVSAEMNTTLAVLERPKFIRELKENSQIALDLLTSLVGRLRKANEIIESFAFLDVKERLLYFLIESSKGKKEFDEHGFLKINKITHKNIALRIGASREAVTKILKTLTNKQLILDKNEYFLLSPDLCKEMDKEFK